MYVCEMFFRVSEGIISCSLGSFFITSPTGGEITTKVVQMCMSEGGGGTDHKQTLCKYVCMCVESSFVGWCVPIGVCYSLREIKHLGKKKGKIEARGVVHLSGYVTVQGKLNIKASKRRRGRKGKNGAGEANGVKSHLKY